jgi:hypothetical protein
MLDPKAALLAAVRYIQRKPNILLHVAINAAGMKVTVPLDALRYLLRELPPSKKAPKEVVIEEQSPALRLAATVDLMGTAIRAGASMCFSDFSFSEEELKVRIELSNVNMRLESDSDSPVAALIKSGALDLSKPGNLAKYMPNRPPALIEAEDNHITLDLMKVPKIAANPKVRRVLELITPVLTIRSLSTEKDSIVIGLQPKPAGIPQVIHSVRAVKE